MLTLRKERIRFFFVYFVIFCQTLQCAVYRWCDPYETFCLFSYGPNVTVSNLTEAQKLCTEAKNDSWPIEITNDQVKNIVTQFMRNNSFSSNSSVCLNAEIKDNKWVWVENNEDVKKAKTTNNVSLCLKSGNYKSCSMKEKSVVICNVTKCRATWISFDGRQVAGATYLNKITNVAACKEKCEIDKSLACTGFEFTPYVHDGYTNSCWIHTRTDLLNCSKGDLTNNIFQVINRTSKSVDICIGNITGIRPSVTTQVAIEKSITSIAVPVVVLLVIIIITTIIFILLWKKYKLKKSSTTNLNTNDVNRVSLYPSNDNKQELNYIDVDFKETNQNVPNGNDEYSSPFQVYHNMAASLPKDTSLEGQAYAEIKKY